MKRNGANSAFDGQPRQSRHSRNGGDRIMRAIFGALVLSLAAGAARAQNAAAGEQPAFTVEALARQLAAHPVAAVNFAEEQRVEGLSRPIRSNGSIRFGDGDLTYQVVAPIADSYHLTRDGVAEHLENGRFVRLSGAESAAFIKPLMLVFSGRIAEARQAFDAQLSGAAGAWRLRLIPKDERLRQALPQLEIAGGTLIGSLRLDQAGGSVANFEFSGHELRGR